MAAYGCGEMAERARGCSSCPHLGRWRRNLHPLPTLRLFLLLLLLLFAGAGHTAEQEERRPIQDTYNLAETVSKLVERGWFSQQPESEKELMQSLSSPQWLKVFHSASQWAEDLCRCTLGKEAWNCKTSSWKRFLSRGTPEAAYFRALLSASVVHFTARACAEGTVNCYNGDQVLEEAFKEGTRIPYFVDEGKKGRYCDYHFRRGAQAAKILDYVDDFNHYAVNRQRRISRRYDLKAHHYNNAVGRELIRIIRPDLPCVCTGYSGSCVVKTCSYVHTDTMVKRAAVRVRDSYKKLLADVAANDTLVASYRHLFRQVTPATVRTETWFREVAAVRHSPDYCHPSKRYGIIGPYRRTCVAECGSKAEKFHETAQCRRVCCGKFEYRRVKYLCNCSGSYRYGGFAKFKCDSCFRSESVCATTDQPTPSDST